MKLTRAQIATLRRLFTQNADGCKSLVEFAGRFKPETLFPGHIIGQWCGMVVGITPEGESHT